MQYIQDIKQILATARHKTYQAINSAMVEAYWKIGEKIVLEEQHGKDRAAYGKQIVHTVSVELTNEFGRGFSERNNRNFRQFYLSFPEVEIWQTLSAKLSWSHFQLTISVSSKEVQKYYFTEAAENSKLFATKYLPFLPTEEELVNEIERQKTLLKLNNEQY